MRTFPSNTGAYMGQTGTTTARAVALAALLMSTSALASDAAVSQGMYKMGPKPAVGDRVPVVGPVFKVYSESATKYDFVGEKNRNLDFLVSGTAFCSSPRRRGRITVEVGGVSASKSKTGKLGRGVVVGDQFQLSVPHSALSGFDPVKACNDGLRTLAAERSESRESLIRRGFSLRYEDVFVAKATASCSGGVVRGHFESDSTRVDAWVDCRPNAKAKEPKPDRAPKRAVISAAAIAPLVTDAELRTDQVSRAMVCPARLTFEGSITTSRPGTVRYRIVGDNKFRTPVYTLNFERAGTKSVRTQVVNVKAPERPPASQTLAANDAPPPPRTVRGWRRLEIVEPEGLRPNERAGYSVICLDEPIEAEEAEVQPMRMRTVQPQ